MNRRSPVSRRRLTARFTLSRQADPLPHSYVVCTHDAVVLPALQRRLIREIDSVSMHPTTVYELNTSHSPFLSIPDQLAQVPATARDQQHEGRATR